MNRYPRRLLLYVTLLNYFAQIPYYLHNYYFPYHTAPSASSVVLIGFTLAWFVFGYIGYRRGWRPGFFLLLTFLVVEAIFYLHSFLFGAFFFQLKNPSYLIKAVFMYGYASGAVAGWYAWRMVREWVGAR